MDEGALDLGDSRSRQFERDANLCVRRLTSQATGPYLTTAT